MFTLCSRAMTYACLFALMMSGPSTYAAVTVPSFFSDHMVLQRDLPIPIWGWAADGEKISVQLGEQAPVTTTAANGAWNVKLSATSAGGPFVVVIKGENEIRISDVLVGEVWLCSGQSNMEWKVEKSDGFAQEKPAATDGQIRQMLIKKRHLIAPDLKPEGQWSVCSSDTVGDFTACGYFMAQRLRAELKVPIGLINSSWGGTPIEPWIPASNTSKPVAASDAALAKMKEPHKKSGVLYNGMVHGVVGYGMRGAIWYQGEANRSDGMKYVDKMRALITGWRTAWGLGDFPFYFVQIAPYLYGKDDPTQLPRFWVAQTAAQTIPSTGMVVTNDIGNPDNIHPSNKKEVGRRLALWALNRTYGQTTTICEGPTFKEQTIEGNKLRLRFDHAEGLVTSDGKSPAWFEVCGTDGAWKPADAVIDGNSVVLSASSVAQPTNARYAWNKIAMTNLKNGAGLPPSAFTTVNKN